MEDQEQGRPAEPERTPPTRPRPGAVAALFAREQKGQVLVILALFLVVLCLFVALITDVARAQLNAVYTQRGSDAGALAGVDFMPGFLDTVPCQDNDSLRRCDHPCLPCARPERLPERPEPGWSPRAPPTWRGYRMHAQVRRQGTGCDGTYAATATVLRQPHRPVLFLRLAGAGPGIPAAGRRPGGCRPPS